MFERNSSNRTFMELKWYSKLCPVCRDSRSNRTFMELKLTRS